MTEMHIRAATAADSPIVRDLIYTVLAEYGLPQEPGATDADLADIDAHYWAQGGHFWVLVDPDGRIVGSCALFPLGRGAVELRKMYLAPACRGQGWGRRLLEHALAEARRLGYGRVELETAGVLKEAIALYQRYGFTRLPRDPHSARCDQLWMLELGV